MSRMSVRTFLIQAKKAINKAESNRGSVSFIIGNQSADLDSITCAIVYAYIQSNALEARRSGRLFIPVTNIPTADLRLRPELKALLKHANSQPSDLVTLDDLSSLPGSLPPSKTDWVLVDHNAFQGPLAESYSRSVVGVIDHHVDEDSVPRDADPRVIERSASCNSLVVNLCRKAWDSISMASSSVGAANGQDEGAVDDAAFTSAWDSQVAKLALASILIDSVNLRAEDKVTEHDRKALKYLEAKINLSPQHAKSYDRDSFFKEINDAKSDLDELSITDILKKDYKEWHDGDLSLGISSCVQPVEYLAQKDTNLVSELVKYSHSLKLDIFALMTAHNTGDRFQRQLILISTADGRPSKVLKDFVAARAGDLDLQKSSFELRLDHKPPFLEFWEQRNLSASRKQVAPMLREAIKR